jgi:hypothetical protein
MSDRPPDTGPDRREVCFIRTRRAVSLRPGIIYEVVARRGDQHVVLARSRKVPADGEEAETARDQLIRQLFRQGWIPTQEPLFIGEEVLGIYVRPPRR